MQSTIFSRLALLGGVADIVMLVMIAWALQEDVDTPWQWTIVAGLLMGLLSKLQFYFYLPTYIIIMWLARWLRNRFWQVPIISMFVTTVVGTLFIQMGMLVVIQLSGTPLRISEAFGYIILPSVLLNLILAIPVHALIADLAQTVYRSQG